MTTQPGAARTLLTLILLLPACAAFAGEFSTVFNGKSYHIGSKENWNEKNYGLGFEYQFDTASRWKPVLMGSGFRDSVKKMSYMAGGGVHRTLFANEHLDGLYVNFGLNAFFMTREHVDNGRPFPGVLPSMTVGNRLVGVNLTYLPKMAVEEIADARSMDKGLRGILYLQFKVNVTELMAVD